MLIRLAGEELKDSILYDSIVDGNGLRTVIFTQGCKHKCKKCHNPITWDFEGGHLVDTQELVTEISSNTFSKRITISGGDPLEQPEECLDLLNKFKSKGFNDFWLFTGYLWEEIIKDKNQFELVKNCDYVVDGKFEIDKKSYDLNFKGSANQRIIDVKQSIKNKQVISRVD